MNQIENVLITGLFDKNYNDFTIGTILDEVISLVETAGGTYSGKIIQKGRYPDRSYLMGKGKVEEIETYIDANDIDMIVSMNPLSSIQQRNLEKKLDIKVIDRTRLSPPDGSVAIEFFQQGLIYPKEQSKCSSWG